MPFIGLFSRAGSSANSSQVNHPPLPKTGPTSLPIGEKGGSLERWQPCANLVQRRLSGELKSSGSSSEGEKLADSPVLVGRVSPDRDENHSDDQQLLSSVEASLDELACRRIFPKESRSEEEFFMNPDDEDMDLFAGNCRQACEDQKLINRIQRLFLEQT